MKRGEFFPRVALTLLDPERNTATVLINIEHHHFHFIAYLNNLGWVDIAIGPVHFGHVNQAFNALLEFGKATIVSQISDLRHGASALWVSARNRKPRIFTQLLEAKRDAVSFSVEFQHLHVDLIANGHDFTRMLDTFPSHVRDV